MPSITFILPHWMYWAGLIVIPLLGMYIVRKQREKKVDGGMSKPIAYLLWLAGGFVGLHRFYVRSSWGLVYIPLFILLLLSNIQVRDAIDHVSKAKNEVSIAVFEMERAESDLKKEKAGARQKVEKAAKLMETAKQGQTDADAGLAQWNLITRILAGIIALLLLVDAFLLPGLVTTCAEKEACEAESATEKISMPSHETGGSHGDSDNWFFYYVNQINGYVGEFICFWSIIAVFVYYYEVLGRYIFNSPTNWAHEGMFLMFGMQYVLAAGFTHREEAHVRVDVLYQYFPVRMKYIANIFTSVFFFIFTIALFWTSWIFMMDSIEVWEVSFTEWAIQYWPVKATLVIGAFLLFLDGLTKLIRDITALTGKKV